MCSVRDKSERLTDEGRRCEGHRSQSLEGEMLRREDTDLSRLAMEGSTELEPFDPRLYDLGNALSLRKAGKVVTNSYQTAVSLVAQCRNNVWYKTVANGMLGLDSEERIEIQASKSSHLPSVLEPSQSHCGLKTGVELLTPLHLAALQGKRSVTVLLLWCGADVHAKVKTSVPSRRGCQATHLACQYGHDNILRWLLSFGADPDAVDDNGNNCFVYALAAKKDMMQVLRSVQRAGTNVNRKNNAGQTPLFQAAKWGTMRGVKFLVEHGADVSAVDDFGMNAIDFAAKHGRVVIAEYLLDASVSQRTKSGLVSLERLWSFLGMGNQGARFKDPAAVLRLLELRSAYGILHGNSNAAEILIEAYALRQRLSREIASSQSERRLLTEITDVREPNDIDFILKFSRRHLLWVSLLMIERNLGDCQETTLAMALAAKELLGMGKREEAWMLGKLCAERLRKQMHHNARSLTILQHLWMVIKSCSSPPAVDEDENQSDSKRHLSFEDIVPVLRTTSAVVRVFFGRLQTSQGNLALEQCLWLSMRVFVSLVTLLLREITQENMAILQESICSLMRVNPVAWGSNILHVALTINNKSTTDCAQGDTKVIRVFMKCSTLVAAGESTGGGRGGCSLALHLAEDRNGCTPLHLASMTLGENDLTRGGMLMSFKNGGADFDRMNRQGLTPGDILLMRGMKVYLWSRLIFARDYVQERCSDLSLLAAAVVLIALFLAAYSPLGIGVVFLCGAVVFAVMICVPFVDGALIQRFWFYCVPEALRRSFVRMRRGLRQHVVDMEVPMSSPD